MKTFLMGFRAEHRQFLDARNAALKFFSHPGVNDISWGTRYTDGSAAAEPAIRFNVAQKKPRGRLHPRDLIPRMIDGIRTDVTDFKFQLQTRTIKPGLEKGVTASSTRAALRKTRFRKDVPYSLVRPLLGGVQIQGILLDGPLDWGTLGSRVFIFGKVYSITSYHVLYRKSGALADNKVFQPKRSLFGEIIGSSALIGDPGLDYVLIANDRSMQWDNAQSLNGIEGLVDGYLLASGMESLQLSKAGAASGVTHGIYDARSLVQSSRVYIRNTGSGPLSLPGDSGSMWVCRDEKRKCLRSFALHQAGDDSGSVAVATLFSSIHRSVAGKLRG